MIIFYFGVLLIPLVSLFIYKRKAKSLRPPGPPGLPFIGNLHQFTISNSHIYLWKLSQKYGPIMSMKFGKVPVLILSSPKLVKEALKTQDLAFSGRPEMYGQYVLSYGGLDIGFTNYNSSWRELRKTCVVHMLSSKQVQSFRPIREEEVSRVIGDISIKASSGLVLNFSESMVFFTCNLICRIAFGRNYDSMEGSGKRKLDKLMIEHQYMQGGMFVSDYLPWFGWVDKVTGMISKLNKAFKGMDDFLQELIDEHLDSKTLKPANPDLLYILIQLKDDKSCSIDLTWNHIKAVIMNILVAGTDTVAATIIWTMTALIKNPRAMKKLQKEIRDLVGTKCMVTEEDVQKLTYLKAVIKESLRLYPPAPLLLPRQTLQETVLAGYNIAPKTLVYVNAWAVARNPEAWANPDEFVPERFLNTKIDITGQDIEVIPFGAGRRGCPGIWLGLATVELLLANLLNSFVWELPSGVEKEDIDTEVLPGITMHKKNPLCCVPKNISNDQTIANFV